MHTAPARRSLAIVLSTMAVGVWLAAGGGLFAQARSLEGAWTLNKDLSDQPPDRQSGQGTGEGRGGGGGGG
jgi:hypothetical protein